jgi:hypothetical protein
MIPAPSTATWRDLFTGLEFFATSFFMSLHDVSAGHLDHCQVCGTINLEEVFDLGHQPLCDSLLTRAQLAN